MLSSVYLASVREEGRNGTDKAFLTVKGFSAHCGGKREDKQKRVVSLSKLTSQRDTLENIG